MEKLDDILSYVKAEVKGFDEKENSVTIEYKDTNRPDLWSVEGLSRALAGLSWPRKRHQSTIQLANPPSKLMLTPKFTAFAPTSAAQSSKTFTSQTTSSKASCTCRTNLTRPMAEADKKPASASTTLT